MTFGQELKIKLAQNGMTQKQLAQRIGLSPTTIALFCTGKREPSAQALQRIDDFIGPFESECSQKGKAITSESKYLAELSAAYNYENKFPKEAEELKNKFLDRKRYEEEFSALKEKYKELFE